MHKEKTQKFFLLIILFSSIFLVWCGEKKTTSQTLSIGGSKIALPSGFESANIDSFSWDGQVIWSYKMPIQNWYSDNLVVLATQWFSGFWNWQLAKLQKNLTLQDISKKTKSINCNNSKIDYDLVNFKISQAGNLDKNAMNVYYSQAYILQASQGYIISFSTNDQARAKNYNSVVNWISCK